MREPERKLLASPKARTKRLLVLLLLLPAVAALTASCGGEDASSAPGIGATAPAPGEGRSAASATPEADETQPAGPTAENAAVASASAERFGMGPDLGPEQGLAPPRPSEPPARAPAAQAPPQDHPAPVARSEPAPSPAPAEPSRASAPETALPEPEETATVAAEAPRPPAAAPPDEGREEAPVAQSPAPQPEAPRHPSRANAAPAEGPPRPAASAPDEAAVPVPSDTTMYLSAPALGLSGAPVVSDSSKEAMDRGVIHVPGTSFPWLPPGGEGSNAYLAAHRIGYPGTGSDRVFYDLPALALGDEVTLTDSNGATYEYRVSEAVEVTPYDTWVANPLPGRDVVTLQTCIEDFGDHWGEGPDWAARYVVRADRVS